jgi:hypothetical protein
MTKKGGYIIDTGRQFPIRYPLQTPGGAEINAQSKQHDNDADHYRIPER